MGHYRDGKPGFFQKMNRLAKEKSPYLSHAADQKIDWYPWSEEAFEKARSENKPVFLSSGAVWCHWCHVMAAESFVDDETASLLNEGFVSIKLDRDERPDIDRRYQNAVIAMGAGSGWPLSIFLTPDRKAFFGGTYFPPEDSHGRPGFKKVLREILKMYRSGRKEIDDYTDRLMNSMNQSVSQGDNIIASLSNHDTMLDSAQEAMLSQFDPQNGGFGTAPKFPMPGAISFLLYRYFYNGAGPAGYAAIKTLESMAKGGFHDQLGGGFHRYSVDEGWIIPHFEKMTDDNAWLLRNYTDAWSIYGNSLFKEVALGIINFTREVLSNPGGGFYASQDADVTPDDEGGYFTWTEDEFQSVLDDEEFRVLSRHLFHDRGRMSHDRSKRVLFIAAESNDISRELKIDNNRVNELIKLGKVKLLGARQKRKEPFIDTTLYTSLNGIMISSYLKAYRAFKDADIRDFALRSLELILGIRSAGKELLHSDGIRALLDDYIYLIESLVAAYEVTGSGEYLEKADRLMEKCLEKFWDSNGGGFFDADTAVLGLSLKAIEDVPHPSANATAIPLLIKLYYSTGKPLYYKYAETALGAFSTRAGKLGVHAGHYFCSLDAYFKMLRLTVEAKPESSLADAAVSSFCPYASISYSKDRDRVLPCVGTSCYEPVEHEGQLREFIKKVVSSK